VRVKANNGENNRHSDKLLQIQLNAIPLPPEFEPSPGTDAEAVVYRPSTGEYWELWVATKTGNMTVNSIGYQVEEWQCRWGGHFRDLPNHPGYFAPDAQGYRFGTTASGLPFLGLTMTIADAFAGVLEHPLGLQVVEAKPGHVWPAQRDDGWSGFNTIIQQGMCFRFPTSIDFDAIQLHPVARMVAKAVQRYGMYVWDRSGAVGFRAENPLRRYNSDPYFGPSGIMHCPVGEWDWRCSAAQRLKNIPWDRLVVVDPKAGQDLA
jgi:hypothetical protein